MGGRVIISGDDACNDMYATMVRNKYAQTYVDASQSFFGFLSRGLVCLKPLTSESVCGNCFLFRKFIQEVGYTVEFLLLFWSIA